METKNGLLLHKITAHLYQTGKLKPCYDSFVTHYHMQTRHVNGHDSIFICAKLIWEHCKHFLVQRLHCWDCPDAKERFDSLCVWCWFIVVDASPRLHSASASWILYASVYLWWVRGKDTGESVLQSTFVLLPECGNRCIHFCFPGAALGRLLGEGVAFTGVTSGQQWASINPGGYALAGRNTWWIALWCWYIDDM